MRIYSIPLPSPLQPSSTNSILVTIYPSYVVHTHNNEYISTSYAFNPAGSRATHTQTYTLGETLKKINFYVCM